YYDDYGHHPAEISATVKALRTLHPNQRLLVMFQSHTYSRTQALKNEFIDALSQADKVYIDQIFPSAREKPGVEKITSHDLELIAQAKGHTHIRGFETRDALLDQVTSDRMPGDVILAIGEKLAKSYRSFHPSERAAVLDTLVSRPVFARALLAGPGMERSRRDHRVEAIRGVWGLPRPHVGLLRGLPL
ncbi:MAG: hypothetical protein EBT00_11020, partial [Proteobacteria bacterium]|nr:hypothetical protein [Pseudomonadota bacterium]